MNVIPFAFGNINLRVRVDSDGEPWFHAGTVCEALGFTNPRQALANHVEPDDVTQHDAIDGMGRTQLTNFVNEAGLYDLIFGSNKASAKHFKTWVTHDVLPTIRKTGGYGQTSTSEVAPPAQNPELQQTLTLLSETLAQNSKLISLLTPTPTPQPTPANLPELPQTLHQAIRANVEKRLTIPYEALKAGPVSPAQFAKQTHTTKARVLNDIYNLRYRGISIKTVSRPLGDAVYELTAVPTL